ncbi:MAG: phosphoenolpyruvate--protein phosphotransferase [Elusimicrobiota bacterium]
MGRQRKLLKGLGVSSGIGHGTAYLFLSSSHLVAPRREILPGEIAPELAKFDAALKTAADDIAALRDSVREKLGTDEAEIFGAQLVVLKDPLLLKDVFNAVTHNKLNIEAAVSDVIGRAAQMLAALPDPYIQERAADVRDIGRRVLSVLMRRHSGEDILVPPDSVIVAEELLPSVTAHMQLKGIRGIVTEKGGRTSHTAIIARSLNVPYAAGVTGALAGIRAGQTLLVDGKRGEVYLDPGPSLLRRYERIETELESRREDLEELSDLLTVTQDGARIALTANVANPDDARSARGLGADGIGLCRTEFLFMGQQSFPTEEEQFRFYKEFVAAMKPAPVTIRVLDLGSDKILPYFPLPAGPSSALTLRGIRLMLKYPEILQVQLKAILRAGMTGAVKILLPMVVDAGDVAEAKRLIRTAETALRAENRRFAKGIPVGAMIEVPSAVITIDKITAAADFLAIGTNDLIQYLLTADRTSPDMASYYDSLHPSVLEALRQVTAAAKKCGKDASVCGEMAADPRCTKLLLGLGVRSLSVVPGKILEVREAVRAVSLLEAEGLAGRALQAETGTAVRAVLKDPLAEAADRPAIQN